MENNGKTTSQEEVKEEEVSEESLKEQGAKEVEKQEEKIEKKIDKVEDKNVELLDKIKNLEQKISENNSKIRAYEQQISDINASYAAKINEKASQANEIVQSKIKELQDKHKSTLEDVKKYGISSAAGQLVDIISQFKGALNFTSDDSKVNNFLMGFKMFDNLLQDLNISEIVIKIGDSFDPNIMDAFDTTNDKELSDNVVSVVLSNAYKLHDRVIKHAVVKVNKLDS